MTIINQQLLTTTPVQVVSAINRSAITVIYICNTSGFDSIIDVFCVPASSGTPSSQNKIYSQLTITGNDTYVISDEKLILENGDALYFASNVANSITVTVSLIEI